MFWQPTFSSDHSLASCDGTWNPRTSTRPNFRPFGHTFVHTHSYSTVGCPLIQIRIAIEKRTHKAQTHLTDYDIGTVIYHSGDWLVTDRGLTCFENLHSFS
jgi:hypothetical protein